MRTPIRPRCTLIGAAVIVLAACQPSPPAIPTTFPTSPPPTVSPPTLAQTEPLFTDSPALTVSPTSTAQPSFTATPDIPLSAEGPWLFFLARFADETPGYAVERGPRYLWAMNADGTGLAQLLAEPVLAYEPLWYPLDPEVNFTIAVITGTRAEPHTLQLQLLNMSDRTLISITSLAMPPEAVDQVTLESIVDAVADPGSLAWERYGRSLAFVAALDGPTADVYRYIPATGEIIRLSSGAGHAGQLSWFFNDHFVIHSALATYGGADSPPLLGIWAARADGQGAVTLVDAKDIEGVTDYEIYCGCGSQFFDLLLQRRDGQSEIRQVDVLAGEATISWQGEAESISRSENGLAWLIAPPPSSSPFVILRRYDGEERRIPVPEAVCEVQWASGALGFFALACASNRVYLMREDREVTSILAPLETPEMPEVSYNGLWWAWYYGARQDTTEGLWINRLGEAPQRIFDEFVTGLIWVPGEHRLIFITPTGLYSAREPDFAPVMIAPLSVQWFDNWRLTWLSGP